jgi:hypothetical protein
MVVSTTSVAVPRALYTIWLVIEFLYISVIAFHSYKYTLIDGVHVHLSVCSTSSEPNTASFFNYNLYIAAVCWLNKSFLYIYFPSAALVVTYRSKAR